MPLPNTQQNKLTKKILTYSTLFISCVALADTVVDSPAVTPTFASAYQIKASNSLWEDKDIDSGFYLAPYRISLFNPKNGEDSERVLSQTYTVIGSGFGLFAILSVLPNSITRWEDDNDRDLSSQWINNVTAGPVWDKDDFYLNYLAHPYFGGVFYQSARKSGYRQWDAFIYSFMMSTFYWEYGVEAFAERPSIQDIVVTPLLGWVYGEWAFNSERDLRLNGSTVLGSATLGNIALFFLDPIDSIGRNINALFDRDIIKAGTGYLTLQQSTSPFGAEKQFSLKVSYNFADDNSDAVTDISAKKNKYSTYKISNIDPVDTGIVGLSAGGIWLDLDNEWGVTNAYGRQFSLGLYFTRHFSARLNYTRAQVTAQQTNNKLIYENYAVNMQYYLNCRSDWRPFISAGVGELMFAQEKKQLQINGGLGLHYKINHNWAVQSDWQHYYSTQTNTKENQLGTRLIYRFGKGEWSL